MTTRCWRDASMACQGLSDTDRRLLDLLARLPLVTVAVLARLLGLRDGAGIYRRLRILRAGGLVAVATPALAAGRSPALWYVTDLGLAVVALAEGVEPGAQARRYGLRQRDLRALVDRLPGLLALYNLVTALAAARPGRPELLAWERPWRATFARPRAKRDGHVRLPAGIALRWGDETRAFLLLPDIGAAPVRAFRRTIGQLLACRADLEAALPPLLVATGGRRRAEAWGKLLRESADARRETIPDARVTTWEHLRAAPMRLLAEIEHGTATLPDRAGTNLTPLQRPVPASPIPRLVGAGFPADAPSPARWALLDLIGHHPFLPSDRLHAALDTSVAETRRRRNHLVERGLARIVRPGEIDAAFARRELIELTAAGLARLAARQELSLGAAVRHNGLAGGGPARRSATGGSCWQHWRTRSAPTRPSSRSARRVGAWLPGRRSSSGATRWPARAGGCAPTATGCCAAAGAFSVSSSSTTGARCAAAIISASSGRIAAIASGGGTPAITRVSRRS